MSASSAVKAKAKARAIDATPAQAAPSANHAADARFVKPQPIPSTAFLNIEYPGILAQHDKLLGSSSSASYTSLERALSTLHPSTLPPLTSNPHEALNFLSRIPNEGIKIVECRLGAFGVPFTSNHAASDSDIDQVYRAPLLGEAVQTHNIVIRIVKRTWRQKKRKRPDPPTPTTRDLAAVDANVLAIDPALFAESEPTLAEPANEHTDAQAKASRYTGRVKKEYIVEVLGMATHTVRFRSMADFAFQPDVSTAQQAQLDPAMALHKALATMDLQALQNFRVPAQLEDYQLCDPSTPDATPKSNLHMVPPAFFSRLEVPFNYNFQQTHYSELRTVFRLAHLTLLPGSTPLSMALSRADLGAGQMQRFVNRVRLSNIAPQPFRVGRDTKVPLKPTPDVVRIEHRCEPKLLARLRELLVERPVWSRVALKNMLDDAELRELQGANEKVYYALVGYSMVGGPWRDTIVRFGFDVRRDASSRIYQRVFLRGGPVARQSKLGLQRLHEDAGEEQDDDDEPPRSAGVTVAPTGSAAERAKDTHIFDGVSLHRTVGNFQLCDVQDTLIKPYIWRTNDENLPQHSVVPMEPMGTQWLSKTSDAETGWYTRRALEMIRALIGARFKALADTGKPLEADAVDAIVTRIRQRWKEEDSQTQSKEPTEVDPSLTP